MKPAPIQFELVQFTTVPSSSDTDQGLELPDAPSVPEPAHSTHVSDSTPIDHMEVDEFQGSSDPVTQDDAADHMDIDSEVQPDIMNQDVAEDVAEDTEVADSPMTDIGAEDAAPEAPTVAVEDGDTEMRDAEEGPVEEDGEPMDTSDPDNVPKENAVGESNKELFREEFAQFDEDAFPDVSSEGSESGSPPPPAPAQPARSASQEVDSEDVEMSKTSA